MKIKIFLAAIFSLVFATAISAQTNASKQNKAADYSGKWVLNVSKSKLNERMKIDSMTMTVSQADKELKIENTIKRTEDADAPPRNVMGGARRGGMGGGDETVVYVLDGKEVVNDMTKYAAGKFTSKGAQEKDGKLKLEQTREFDSPAGPAKIKTSETWSLSADGKTLTVNRETVTPRGTNTSEMVFTKQ